MTATAHDHQVPEQLTLKLSPEARESLEWIAPNMSVFRWPKSSARR